MNSRLFATIGGTSVAALLAVSMIVSPALAAGNYLDIKKAASNVSNGKLSVALTTAGKIPLDGQSGAFGYAVLTGGLNNVLVLVTHMPIDDSTHEDPVSGFHTHVLDLKAASSDCSTHDLEVDLAGSGANSAFDSDYKYVIKGGVAAIAGVPTTDLGGNTVGGIVSFTVTPVFTSGSLTNLCVDVIDAA